MMKNRTTKILVNGAVLAAVAVVGVTAYQLSTPSREELVPEEVKIEGENIGTEKPVEEKEPSMVDAGTSKVEASMEETSRVKLSETGEFKETAKEEKEQEREVNQTDLGESASVSTASAAANIPTLNFSEDTLMEWPVRGNILLDYSMDQTTYFPTLDQYRLSSGISVQAVEGAPVMAACEGQVFSIDQDAKTGTTVTMELGNGYQSVYGQLTDLTVQEGETVKKGAIIGYIGAPTKYYSREGSNLYYAMKKNGEPIDPILYLP